MTTTDQRVRFLGEPIESEIPVRTVMTSPVITVTPEASVDYAVAVLLRCGFTTLPVTDAEGNLVGVLTEDEAVQPFLRGALRRRRDERTDDHIVTVRDAMLAPTLASVDDSILDVAETMLRLQLRSIPLLDNGKPVGIVSWRDVFRCFSR
jgi:CBS domain-containing protein